MNSYAGYIPPYNLESSNNGACSSSGSNNFDFSSNEDHTKTWKKSGKRVEGRLVTVLEQVGEIYDERHELVSKILRGEHEDVFHKIGSALKKKKSMKKSGSMKRSMSMRAKISRQRGIEEEITEANELRNQRFKVRTPNVIEEAEDDGQGDQPPTKTSSK
ncbi:hypothetical protein C2S53_011419 [Perilla frutescens var. hirtella]|uniref:Uncharacterized protein n=1 Tax=Perilla frutescens var. hirtella TaxID=608512 RepID=A0AAD4J9G0_PERFH|nr:hypothetical protein C2S53_011419 [Perilla frutescens var. hirtella]